MLPASCRLFSDSKSNSSTRFPSTTTTRVSSAWVASISIFFVMVSFANAASVAGADATGGVRRSKGVEEARDQRPSPGPRRGRTGRSLLVLRASPRFFSGPERPGPSTDRAAGPGGFLRGASACRRFAGIIQDDFSGLAMPRACDEYEYGRTASSHRLPDDGTYACAVKNDKWFFRCRRARPATATKIPRGAFGRRPVRVRGRIPDRFLTFPARLR